MRIVVIIASAALLALAARFFVQAVHNLDLVVLVTDATGNAKWAKRRGSRCI